MKLEKVISIAMRYRPKFIGN